MEFNGGANNAYTENVTVYTNWFPASAAEVIFDLEGDRISSLVSILQWWKAKEALF
jgi:hypothetical protein